MSPSRRHRHDPPGAASSEPSSQPSSQPSPEPSPGPVRRSRLVRAALGASLAAAVALVGAGPAAAVSEPVPGSVGTSPFTTGDPAAAGRFRSVEPTRVLDTRGGQPLSPGRWTTAQVIPAGVSPVPASVVVTLTALTPTTSGYLAAGAVPAGALHAVTFDAGVTVDGLVRTPVDPQGRIAIGNASKGTVHVLVTVVGVDVAQRSGYVFRDTSPPTVLGAAGGPVTIAAGATARIEASQVAALLVGIRVSPAARAGWLRVAGSGGGPSTLNFPAGRTVTGLAVVHDPQGFVAVTNSAPVAVSVVLTLHGTWVAQGSGTTARPVTASRRILETWAATGPTRGAALAPGETVRAPLPDGDVPGARDAMVAISTLADAGTRSGWLEVGGSGNPDVAITAGSATTGLAVAPVVDGAVAVTNRTAGPLHLVVDLVSVTAFTPPVMTSAGLGFATLGKRLVLTPAATGGSGRHTWTVEGLPAGLKFDAGRIVGRPEAVGVSPVTLAVADGAGRRERLVVPLSVVGPWVTTVPRLQGTAVAEVTQGAVVALDPACPSGGRGRVVGTSDAAALTWDDDRPVGSAAPMLLKIPAVVGGWTASVDCLDADGVVVQHSTAFPLRVRQPAKVTLTSARTAPRGSRITVTGTCGALGFPRVTGVLAAGAARLAVPAVVPAADGTFSAAVTVAATTPTGAASLGLICGSVGDPGGWVPLRPVDLTIG